MKHNMLFLVIAIGVLTLVVLAIPNITKQKPPTIMWVNEAVPGAMYQTVLKLPTTNGLVEIGMRSDGVVVWRPANIE